MALALIGTGASTQDRRLRTSSSRAARAARSHSRAVRARVPVGYGISGPVPAEFFDRIIEESLKIPPRLWPVMIDCLLAVRRHARARQDSRADAVTVGRSRRAVLARPAGAHSRSSTRRAAQGTTRRRVIAPTGNAPKRSRPTSRASCGSGGHEHDSGWFARASALGCGARARAACDGVRRRGRPARLQASCANCHGPDGNLIAGIDFGRGLFRRAISDDELARRSSRRHPEHADAAESDDAPRRRRCASSTYLRSMGEGRETTADGDARRGRALFEGKGECRDCHAVRRRRLARRPRPHADRSRAPRRRARALAARSRSRGPAREPLLPRRRRRAATAVIGRLLNRDTFTVQLSTRRSGCARFRWPTCASTASTTRRCRRARDKLSPQEIADVVSYLLVAARDRSR